MKQTKEKGTQGFDGFENSRPKTMRLSEEQIRWALNNVKDAKLRADICYEVIKDILEVKRFYKRPLYDLYSKDTNAFVYAMGQLLVNTNNDNFKKLMNFLKDKRFSISMENKNMICASAYHLTNGVRKNVLTRFLKANTVSWEDAGMYATIMAYLTFNLNNGKKPKIFEENIQKLEGVLKENIGASVNSVWSPWVFIDVLYNICECRGFAYLEQTKMLIRYLQSTLKPCNFAHFYKNLLKMSQLYAFDKELFEMSIDSAIAYEEIGMNIDDNVWKLKVLLREEVLPSVAYKLFETYVMPGIINKFKFSVPLYEAEALVAFFLRMAGKKHGITNDILKIIEASRENSASVAKLIICAAKVSVLDHRSEGRNYRLIAEYAAINPHIVEKEDIDCLDNFFASFNPLFIKDIIKGCGLAKTHNSRVIEFLLREAEHRTSPEMAFELNSLFVGNEILDFTYPVLFEKKLTEYMEKHKEERSKYSEKVGEIRKSLRG